MLNWDYNLPQNWQPQNDLEWRHFLTRRINYDQLKGLPKQALVKYFDQIQAQIDPGKRVMLEYFLNK